MTAGPVRVGVLGCAEIARRRMMPALAASGGTELVAVAARDAHRARETAREHGCVAAHGYEALLADASVRAVYVPLPVALHGEWVEAALRAGKHVLAEKPLTTDPGRTAGLFALARARGLALMENVMFVHHTQHAAVDALITDGAIGELRSFRAEFSVPRRPEGDIRHRPELGGGALWDTGVYPVRAALRFLGETLEVSGASLLDDAAHGVDIGGGALLRTPRGVTAHLAFGLDHAYRSVYELTGSQGRITLEHAFTPPADHRPTLRLERASGVEERVLEPYDQVAAAVSAFAAAARTGTAPADASLHQARLLESIRTAARSSDSGAADLAPGAERGVGSY